MKTIALLFCLAPAVSWAAGVRTETPALNDLRLAASGGVSLDRIYDNQSAAAASIPADGTLGALKNAPRPNLAAQAPAAMKDEAVPSPRALAAARKGVEKADSDGPWDGFLSAFNTVFTVPFIALWLIPYVGPLVAVCAAAPLFVLGCIAGGIGALIAKFF